MGHSSHGILAALFYLAIFNHMDQGLATLETGSIRNARNLATVLDLSIRPVPQDAGSSDALIRYDSRNTTSYGTWVTSLRAFLEDYKTPGTTSSRGRNLVNCDYRYPPPPGRVCNVDIREFGPCVEENNFGYHRGTPCIFLKLDTPPGWTPTFYNDSNSLPVDMPSDLKSHIANIASINPTALNTVWVSCAGVNPADVEFIGPLMYSPVRGFREYYFLNSGTDGYLSPLVAVAIERPSQGVLISIKCKAWARNIDNNNSSGQGVGQFGLLID